MRRSFRGVVRISRLAGSPGGVEATRPRYREDLRMSFRKPSWKVRFLLGALTLVLLSGKPAFGQTQAITATLNGAVADSSGEAVTGAKLTLTSAERGISRASSTGNT